jgi:hypothetical protein
MKPSLKFTKESFKKISRKTGISLLVFITLFSFLITPLHEAHAQLPVTDLISATWQAQGTIWQKITNTLKIVWQKAGSVAFQQVVRSSLNKIAYDTANYLGSGGKGQKPLFITQDWGAYLGQVGDEAAGSFISNFAANLAKPYSAQCQAAYQTCANAAYQQGKDCVELDSNPQEICDANEEADINICKDAAIACSNKVGSSASSTTASTNSAYANNPSFNVCQPSSIEAKVKISLGLVAQQSPATPNCTASTMIQNWGDAAKKLTDFSDPNFLANFKDIFNPTSNDLGIYLTAATDMTSAQVKVDQSTSLNLTANKGWQDKTNIAKNLVGVPGAAEAQRTSSGQLLNAGIGKVTGDIVVDAANVFLNQYAITAFSNLMSSLGTKVTSNSSSASLTNSQSDPGISYGEGNLQEITSSIIQPDFGVRADYDILTSLSVCPDSKNPGPTDCVIDNKFMQAISEKKTVAEAIQSGYLNGSWQLTQDTIDSAYSLRNISILRKYRILPIGWEEAINRAYADPSNPIKVTLMDLVSCFDPNDSYNQFSSGFNTSNQAWCRGLVDPNWVLKAPLNYCKKEGVGSQILNTTINPGVLNGNTYTPSSLDIVRSDNYCADEQTCIKEKADGSCDAYGYCNEEKRTWNFSSDSCDPIYNTCQSFTNSTSGQNVSYLENTLNYSGCNADSAGCSQYSVFGTYASSTGTVNWDAGKSVYFNKNVAACNPADEGCTELLRVKPTWGANLVMDSYFSESIGASSTNQTALGNWSYTTSANAYYNNAAIVDASQTPGQGSGKALELQANSPANSSVTIGIYSDLTHPLLPANFEVIPGYSYTVSADVYIEKGSSINVYLGDPADGYAQSTQTLGSWQHLTATRSAADSYNEPTFGVSALGDTSGSAIVYIQNVKFEVSNFDNTYSLYGAYKFYQKIIPPYLEKVCYNGSNGTDYTLRSDAPAICNNFARKCNQAEVGCELFTGTSNGLSVPAQVTSADYCPQECVGYDTYISTADHFDAPQSENIIPATATTCTADVVGCNEFTNLDTLSQGGESKEYYTSLKQCIKPDQTMCGSFYSWEGTTSGYQLKLYSLQKDTQGAPAVTEDDSAVCNATIYSKAVNDPAYNPDCQEFYNASGQVSYHLMARTITCSDNCHAYRMSGVNIDKTKTSITDCTTSANPKSGHWDGTTGTCYYCANGGSWDDQSKACIYQAIPGEGQTCSAAQNGCREYNGNDGNNVKLLATYDFEAGAQTWHSNCVSGVQLTTISNNKDGHSLFYKNLATSCSPIGQEAQNSVGKLPIIKQVFASDNVAAELNVGSTVESGKSYSLRFIAKADGDTHPQIYFYNNDATNPQKSYFATSTLVVKGGGDWNVYQVNLDNLDHTVTGNEVLVITADNDFYFDDVALTEITDRYDLIKGTSVIPDICSYDIFDKYQGADYNLGCAQYTDRDNLTHNLHKFSKLCSTSSVGCEQMIATQNYSPYGGGVWGDLKVPGDAAIYAVYDSSKLCNSADKGCSRLGQSIAGGTDWSDVFEKNDPDAYSSTLCSQTEVGCQAWSTSDGTLSYFRDPGNGACQYRDSHDPANPGKAWFTIPVMRCDLNNNSIIDGTEKTGKICATNADCAIGSCIIDTNDYPCSTSYLKTFGLGGAGNQVPTPDTQAGVCDATASGCTEYIDPVSNFAANLIDNAAYETGSDGTIANWTGNSQIVAIEPNKVYIFSVSGGKTATNLSTIGASSGVKQLLSDNTLDVNKTSFDVSAGTSTNILFASLTNTQIKITGGEAGKILSLKESAINYQLQDNVDKTSCNGQVNTDNGCILFNERSVNGANGLTSLVGAWNAAGSLDKAAPTNCDNTSANACTANQLIKVAPDRTCSKWLDCVTYVQDPVTKARTCYALGECTKLDDKGECSNFENVSTSTVQFSNSGANKNSTGYNLLNQYQLANMQEVGLNSDAHYDFEDSVPTLSCQRVGGGDCVFNKNIVTDLLVREPDKAPTDYPAHGASYLKVPASYIVSPESKNSWVAAVPSQDYYLNFLVNTKNSGLDAMVTITTKTSGGTTASVSQSFNSNDGWSRKIMPFKTGTNVTSFRIDLSTATNNSDGAVYFDDINVEPVLETGKDTSGNAEYVARECRLYPDNSSLTCLNKNNNVLKDGLEGYCLQHDTNNKDVCLMWYPIDNISSTALNHNSSGYQGQFPLNYCTEVNGNFDLVNKIEGKLFAIRGYYTGTTGGHDGSADIPGLTTDILQNIDKNLNFVPQTDSNPYSCTAALGQDSISGCYCLSKINSTNLCGSANYYAVVGRHWDGSFGAESINAAYYCVPDKDKLIIKDATPTTFTIPLGDPSDKEIVCSASYIGGWAKYSGGLVFRANRSLAYGNNKVTDPVTSILENIDEANNITDPVRVYDYNAPPADENGLKLVSGTDTDKIFRLTCNNFINVVDSNGDNQAWAKRISINSAWPTSTPPFFVDNSSTYYNNSSVHGLVSYGRNRANAPFGAATWPDSLSLLNSDVINLRNQFSTKNNEDTSAGTPYGCSNYNGTDSGAGCNDIGYCSLNPDVYCLTQSGDSFVSKQTCAGGGFGTCVPLWKNYLGQNGQLDYQNILKTLFLKSYGSYRFTNGAYVSGGENTSLNTSNTSLGLCPSSGRPVADFNSLVNAKNSFCYVNPVIGTSTIVTYNNKTVANSNVVTVSEKGIYGLQFTSIIDPEQQPLKQIKIDWDDGSTQIITGQDSHPSAANPHIFYHYYKQTGTRTIHITITDNWDEVASN